MLIRPATKDDHDALWGLLEPVLREGETYALDRGMSRDAALAYWTSGERQAFVAVRETRVLGSYFIRTNHPGGGAHVANCGYVTALEARRNGVARALCLHSLEEAKRRGYRAVQFNFVVSTNETAVRLWQSLGFAIAGRLPGAFQHPRLGPVDVFVMFQSLDE
jgi:ribosomal protein S18 acetylase RimI-like enzyme